MKKLIYLIEPQTHIKDDPSFDTEYDPSFNTEYDPSFDTEYRGVECGLTIPARAFGPNVLTIQHFCKHSLINVKSTRGNVY